MSQETGKKKPTPGAKWLDAIERLGNRLPHPMTLFIIGAVAVLVISQIAASSGWTVEKTVMQEIVINPTKGTLSNVSDTLRDNGPGFIHVSSPFCLFREQTTKKRP